MSRPISSKRIFPLAAIAVAAAQTGAAFAASSHGTGTHTYRGPVEYNEHGPVQVSITTRNHKIIKVSAAINPADGRSIFIQGQAIPLLKQETLKARSARIDLVSGATDTSISYIQSLQAAVNKAKHSKALK